MGGVFYKRKHSLWVECFIRESILYGWSVLGFNNNLMMSGLTGIVYRQVHTACLVCTYGKLC